MMTVREIKHWLDTLDSGDDALVGIDEGGLILVAMGEEGAYLEVGGADPDTGEEEPE